MPDNSAVNAAVIEILYKTAGVNDVKAATSALKSSEEAAKQIARQGVRAFNEVSQATRGFNRELSDAAGYASNVFGALAMGTGVGAGLMLAGTAFSFIIGKMKESEEAAQKAREPYDKLLQTLRELDKLSDPLAQGLREQLGVGKESAQAIADLARKDDDYNASVQRTVDLAKAASRANLDLKAAYDELRMAQAAAMTEQGAGLGLEERARARYEEAAEAVRLHNMLLQYNTRQLEQKAEAEQVDVASWARAHAVWESRAESYKKAADELKKMTDALRTANEVANAALRGMVEKALTPTAVTPEDLQATAAGKYVDKWDETRRRWEAMAKGQGQPEWLKEADMLKQLGLSAEEAAKKFKDFSLFADPTALKLGLVNWDALTGDVEAQLDAMVGKYNLTQKAMEKVWDKMAPERKEALKKLGIESLDDATKSLLGLAPSKLNIVPAPEFQPNLTAMHDAILAAIPPSMYTTVYVEYKTSPPGGSGGGGGGGSVPSTVGRSEGSEYQHGGMGIFERTGPIFVHAGERFWISGTHNETPPPFGGPLIGQAVIGNDMDLERVAWRLMKLIRAKGR